MSIANPGKVCYRHILSRNGILPPNEVEFHLYNCSGYNRHVDASKNPDGNVIPHCFNFVSVGDIKKGICAYEQRAKNGFGESPVKTEGHSCINCDSDDNSGRDSNGHRACTSYTPMLQVILGSCAWHLRSQRLVDLYNGDRSQLKSEELHCLEGCDASRSSSCPGYIDIKYVVEQTCSHKVNLINKLRFGGSIEGLEEICAECEGQCNSRKCDNSYTNVVELHQFEVWNDIHPLTKRRNSQVCVA